MGGNVFKNSSTRRYTKEEYESLSTRIVCKLQLISSKFRIIPSYADKESFGDMDVLVVPLSINNWNTHDLNQLFSSMGNVVHNGGVWSLVFEELQIDLITTTVTEFDAALDYFSYNDFGNLRGKIVHKFGLKYGHNGLSLPVKSNNHTLGTIMLSQNPEIINNMFGFKLAQFRTLEEMFESVVRSHFFSPVVFAWDQMNATARIRDKKRTTYHSFLKYIEGNEYPHRCEFDIDKSTYLPWIFKNFPTAQPEYIELWKKKEMIEDAAKKFNGELVTMWTGRRGIELGDIMKILKPIFPAEYVVNATVDEIKHVVLSTHNTLLTENTI
jgi:hypothetical protein